MGRACAGRAEPDAHLGHRRHALSLDVAATYRVGGDPQLRTFNARAAIDAQVAPAIYEMGAASSLLPLLCFARGGHAMEADTMTAPVDYAIETNGLMRRFGDVHRRRRRLAADSEGTSVRLPGPERRGKDDDDPHADDAAAADRAARRGSGDTTSSREPLAVRGLVGLVSDETSESHSTWTAREYLGYFARIRAARDAAATVERILDDVGLDPAFRGKLIGTYSTGMKRRVEIARALMGAPKVLFLDEPTRGLDLPAKREMWNLLRRLAAASRT